MRTLLLATICLLAIAANAQQSPELKTCMSTAQNQHAMHVCAGQELQRADNELLDVYEKMVSNIADKDLAKAKIEALHTAWHNYCLARLDALYPAANKQAEYGIIYPMNADLLLADWTRTEAAILRKRKIVI
jgi:uncharacterized protein YecT (DUF1311 family)